MKNMENIMKILDSAFGTMCQITVKGNDVELMVAAKQALREAYVRLDKLRKEASDGQTD
jgi:hypothetical protein